MARASAASPSSSRLELGSSSTSSSGPRAIASATEYAHKPENRADIIKAIAPANYLNQPIPVLEQVMTGRFADGLGKVRNVPDRVDFDPFPWPSMAVWMLTQLKRWGYLKGEVLGQGATHLTCAQNDDFHKAILLKVVAS